MKILKVKLTNLNSEKTVLTPKYLSLIDKNVFYLREINAIKGQMNVSQQFEPFQSDITKINDEVAIKFREYEAFKNEFKSICEHYKILNEQIQNFINSFNKITSYNNKILNYFEQ